MNIALAFSHLIEFSILFIFFDMIFQAKRKNSQIYFLGLALYSMVFLLYLAFDSTVVNIIAGTVCNFIFGILFYECRIKDAIFSSLFLTVSMTASEFIAISLISFGNGGNINSYKSSFSAAMLTILFSRTIHLIISILISHLLPSSRRKRLPLFLFLFPSASTVVLYTLYVTSANSFLTDYENYLIIGSGFSVVASILLTYVFYSKTTKELNDLYKAQSEQDKIESDAAYYAILDKQNEQLKTVLHDEKNHLFAIKSLANNPEVSAYIDEIYGHIAENSLFGNTKNKLLDLTINKYQYICEDKNINFNVSIKTANLSHIETSDLTTLLGNLLDNAVDAAKRSKNRKIDFSLNKVNEFEVLTCINSCDESPNAIGDYLITTKRDSGFHGLGINSIKRIVKKYHGNFEWSYNENDKEFTVYIAF